MELQGAKEQIAKEEKKRKGRVMLHYLNKIGNKIQTQAWDRWIEVHQAMARAGRIMQRVMCRFTEGQLVKGFNLWLGKIRKVMESAALMDKCLSRIQHVSTHRGFHKWIDCLKYERIMAQMKDEGDNQQRLKVGYDEEMRQLRLRLAHEQEARLHELRLQSAAIEEAHQHAIKALKVRVASTVSGMGRSTSVFELLAYYFLPLRLLHIG